MKKKNHISFININYIESQEKSKPAPFEDINIINLYEHITYMVGIYFSIHERSLEAPFKRTYAPIC